MANKYPYAAIEANRLRAEKKRVFFKCKYCGKEMFIAPSIANDKGGKKYCSWGCRTKAMRGENAPNYGNSDGISRDKNPNWKGGVSRDRKGRRMVEKQAKWRRAVFRRDSYICQRCGYNKGKRLNAHHIAPWADSVKGRFNISNGVTLCKECHAWVHSDKNTKGEYLCK